MGQARTHATRAAAALAVSALLLVPAAPAGAAPAAGLCPAAPTVPGEPSWAAQVPELRPATALPAGLLAPPIAPGCADPPAALSGSTADAARAAEGGAPDHASSSAPAVQAGAPTADGPGVLTGVLGGGRERPFLHLALLAAGLLLLLLQSRVPDPELAGAPVVAEPWLEFEQFPRNGGGR